MSNRTYDILKTIALLIAPIATFFAALAEIWGIPYGSQIVATLAALDALMGAIVAIAKAKWDKEQAK
ncbi:MAG: hypothetical protein J6T17_06465 [Clostridia bacterium]|nr:hypothetical protein [Clostridia bacterium]